MRAFLGTLDDLAALSASVDVALGYPKNGTPIGNGIHTAPEKARVLRHAAPIQNPTSGEWAYPVDDVSEVVAVAQLVEAVVAQPSRGVLSGEGASVQVLTPESPSSPVVELDSTWFAPLLQMKGK